MKLDNDGARKSEKGVLRVKSFKKTMDSERVSRFGNLTGFMASIQLITEA